VSRGNGASPPDPLENLDDAIEELRGSEWEDEEITAEHLLDAVKMGAVIATGKHQAMSKDQADEITLTDHGVPPKSESVPPRQRFVLKLLDKVPAESRGTVVVVGLLVFGALAALSIWRGGAGLGWW
jgi:hypothetical protein